MTLFDLEPDSCVSWYEKEQKLGIVRQFGKLLVVPDARFDFAVVRHYFRSLSSRNDLCFSGTGDSGLVSSQARAAAASISRQQTIRRA